MTLPFHAGVDIFQEAMACSNSFIEPRATIMLTQVMSSAFKMSSPMCFHEPMGIKLQTRGNGGPF